MSAAVCRRQQLLQLLRQPPIPRAVATASSRWQLTRVGRPFHAAVAVQNLQTVESVPTKRGGGGRENGGGAGTRAGKLQPRPLLRSRRWRLNGADRRRIQSCGEDGGESSCLIPRGTIILVLSSIEMYFLQTNVPKISENMILLNLTPGGY